MISKRIQQIADYKGLSISQFEKTIGTSEGVFRKMIKNNSDIHSKWLSLISEKFPEINTTWLLTGKGEIENKENDFPEFFQISLDKQIKRNEECEMRCKILANSLDMKEKECERLYNLLLANQTQQSSKTA